MTLTSKRTLTSHIDQISNGWPTRGTDHVRKEVRNKENGAHVPMSWPALSDPEPIGDPRRCHLRRPRIPRGGQGAQEDINDGVLIDEIIQAVQSNHVGDRRTPLLGRLFL